jgi:hypothetical protein
MNSGSETLAAAGGAVESGHYNAEEAPQDVLEAFERFFV